MPERQERKEEPSLKKGNPLVKQEKEIDFIPRSPFHEETKKRREKKAISDGKRAFIPEKG